MVKKNQEDTEDDIEDFEDEEDDEDEDSEEEEEPVKKKKGKLKSKDWVIQHFPETWTVLDPRTKEVIASAPTMEELNIQLQVISAQKSSEASMQTE